MKVLTVVHGFPPQSQGGAEIYARAHALALQELHGDEVVVLTRDQDPARAENDVRTERQGSLRVVRVNNTFRNTRTFEETYRNAAIDAIASRVIDEFKPDVAHIHHLTCLSTGIVGSLAERGIPRFVTLHDYWLMCHRGQLLDINYRVCAGPEPSGCQACLGLAGGVGAVGFVGAGALRALERRVPAAAHLRWAAEQAATFVSSGRELEDQARKRLEHMRAVCAEVTHFFAPSQYMRDRFVQFGIEPERITLAGYGFDAAAFRGIERMRSDRLRLGFLGSLMVSKAPHVLLDAVGRLPPGSVSVDLVGGYAPYHGDDSYRRTLEPLMKGESVHMRGAVGHDQIPQALASIDVLVVPSIWPENSPLVIQEAFLAGVPVVASRVGGIPEVVSDGRNGLLFNAGDAADLARTLSRLLHEPGLLERLRAGLPPVRSLAEDVGLTRGLYHARETVPASRPRLAAVVLNFRTPDDTFLAVRSLVASRRPIDEIIVVNNDSRDDARHALKDVASRINYLHTGRNLGFSGGANVGIREALAHGAERVLLVNSDVIVPPDCIERLEQCLKATPQAGIVGPVVLSRSEPDRIASLGMTYTPFTARMRHRGAGALLGADGARPRSDRDGVDGVSGCLMLVRREVFDAVGLFDEDYFFSFEDLDLCLRARRAGLSTVLAGAAFAYHESGRSIGATSARRLYFAARNHLLMARRAEPSAGRLVFLRRASSIVALNLAHAVRSTGDSLPRRLSAVVRGTFDYMAGRLGAGSESDRLLK